MDTSLTDEDRAADILHNVRVGVRYHMVRQGLFDNLHRTTGIVSLIASSAAFASFWHSSPVIGAAAAAVVAVAQAFDLWCDFRGRSELHRDLRNRYVELEPDALATDTLDTAGYARFKRRIANIEIREPPIHHTLMRLCQNNAATVSGFTPETAPETFTHLGFWRTHFPNLL